MIGRQLGNYRITDRLGGGGVGEVWKAEDVVLGRPVALKALRPELAARETVVARFRSEAQTLARLNHPHIATLYALLEEPPSLYMVMEYVEGMTLAGLLAGSGRLDPALACDLFLQALDGIGHAHAAGVVHRDVKGSNLMLDASGRVKVMDFGIARAVGSARMTRLGNLVGTPEFMAPEQIRGGEATVRSDVYALGVLLHEMLAGEVPFRGEAEFDVLRAHVESPPRPLRSLVPEVPEAVERAVLRALEKEPERRFASTEDFAAALEAAGMRARATPVPELTSRAALPEAQSEAPTEPGAAPPEPAPGAGAAPRPPAPASRAVDPVEEAATPGASEAPAPPPTRVIDLGAGGPDPTHPDPTRPDRPTRAAARRRIRWAALAATAALALGAGFLKGTPSAEAGPEAGGGAAVAAAQPGEGKAPAEAAEPGAGGGARSRAEGPVGGAGGGASGRLGGDATERSEPSPSAAHRRPEPTDARDAERPRRGWVIRWE